MQVDHCLLQCSIRRFHTHQIRTFSSNIVSRVSKPAWAMPRLLSHQQSSGEPEHANLVSFPANQNERYEQWGLVRREGGCFLRNSLGPGVEECCLVMLDRTSLKGLAGSLLLVLLFWSSC